MDSKRIKEIHKTTAYPQSISVYKALLQVWNECEQEGSYSEEDLILYSDYVADCRLLETYPILDPKDWFKQFKK